MTERQPGFRLVPPRPFLCIVLALAVAAGRAAEPAYVSPAEVELERFLAPPPAADSPAQRTDLGAVLDIQRTRTEEQVEAARADQNVSVFRFADVLGETFSEERLPRTAALGQKACSDASAVTSAAKKIWGRPRPYVASRDVRPVITHSTAGSYPSGHATCGYLWAILLADMIPEKRDELFARGVRYGQNRVIGGVHYPSDVEAGRLGAAVIAASLFNNPAFRGDFAAARAELRQALGY